MTRFFFYEKAFNIKTSLIFANSYKHEMSQVEQIILFICDVAQQILLNKIKVDKDTRFAENLR